MREMEAGRPPEIKRSRKPARPVKREVNQEMKSFAESTMNELLGWYGYEEVDLRDVSGAENRKPCVKRHVSVLRENSVPTAQAEGASPENERPGQREAAKARSIAVSSSVSSSTTSSSSEGKEPRATHVIVPLIKPSAVEEVQNVLIVCVWCQREGVRRFSLLMGRQLKSFCSEKCFFACRRAHFKRNKASDSSCHGDESPSGKEEEDSPPTPKMKCSNINKICDWCKRLQPTQEYVSTGTGDERLYFCSSECVNQYKMDVFYREARAALTIRQSAEDHSAEVKDSKVKEGSPKSPLLTPASWTRASKPAHSPKSPLAPSSSSSSSSSTISEPVGVCKRTSLSHTSVSSPSSFPSRSSANQERFTIARVTVPCPPPPAPQSQCSPLPPPPPPPPPLIIRPQTPHTLQSHTPPSPSSHTRSPPHPFAVGQSRPSFPPPHTRPPPPSIIPPILTPAFPGAPMMHLPPGCPPPPPPLMLPRLAFPVPSLPAPFPQNTLLVPYPIIIPLPVPVPIPLPLPLPAGMLTPSLHTSSPTTAHTPPTDEGDITHAGVCVKAEDGSSPHTDASAHTWVQEPTEAHSTHFDAEGDEGKEKGQVEEEREMESEEEEEDEEEEDDKVRDKKLLVNGRREQWRERRGERKVIQCLTAMSVLRADSEAKNEVREQDTIGEAARSLGQHSPAHTANNNTMVLKRHTLSPHTHQVIHLTHTAQTAALTQHPHTHTHATSAVQGLAADQTHALHSPRITHTNSSHAAHLPTVPRVATCAVSQIVAMPTDSTHKLSPPPEPPKSPSVNLKEGRTGQCHELTERRVSESDGSTSGAEEESFPKDEERTDCQHTPDKHTHMLKRAHTQMQPHTPSMQQKSAEEELEEKRCCLQIRDQNT